MEALRICNTCNIEKSLDEYYLIRRSDSKKRAICKECEKAQKIKSYNENYTKKTTGLDKLVNYKVITNEQKEEIIKLLQDPMVKVISIAKKYNIEYNILQYYKKKKLVISKKDT